MLDEYRRFALPEASTGGPEPVHVFDPVIGAEVLKSKSFEVISMAHIYRDIAARTGIDFDAIVKVLDRTPLFLNSEQHKLVRAEMARVLADKRAAQTSALETSIDGFFDSQVRPGAVIELTSQLTRPLYHAVMAPVLGMDTGHGLETDDLSRLFDPILSLKRRQRINARIEALLARPDDIITPTLLAMTILGHDPFVGGLSLSIYRTIANQPGMRLSDMRWDPQLSATALPYVDRIAVADWNCNSVQIMEGQRVRIFIGASSEYGPLETQDVLFGRGAHLCLGRMITQLAWQMSINRFQQCNCSATASDLQMRAPDTLFDFPSSSRITLHG